MVMSDRIGVMRAGKLVQVGAPKEIDSRPTVRLRVHGRGQCDPRQPRQ